MVMDKQLYILRKHGGVAFSRLGHLGVLLLRVPSRDALGLYQYPQAQRVTCTRSADAGSNKAQYPLP
jgi:hypothetical protein